jgi:hypothetical protein
VKTFCAGTSEEDICYDGLELYLVTFSSNGPTYEKAELEVDLTEEITKSHLNVYEASGEYIFTVGLSITTYSQVCQVSFTSTFKGQQLICVDWSETDLISLEFKDQTTLLATFSEKVTLNTVDTFHKLATKLINFDAASYSSWTEVSLEVPFT